MHLETAKKYAAELRKRLRFPGHKSVKTTVVGSIRRGEADVKDIDLLIVAPDIRGVLAAARLRSPKKGDVLSVARILSGGARRKMWIVSSGRRRFQVDLFSATPEEKPFALFHHTGDSKFNIRTRAHAKKQGWLLNQYGLFDRDTGRPLRKTIKSERDLFRVLGVTWLPPRDRDG